MPCGRARCAPALPAAKSNLAPFRRTGCNIDSPAQCELDMSLNPRFPFRTVDGIPDGDYRIRVSFKGIDTAVYPLRVHDGIPVLIFPFKRWGQPSFAPLAIDPRPIVRDESGAADFAIRDQHPNPFLSFRSNERVLANLDALRVVRSGRAFGFLLNGEPILKIDGELAWRNFPNFLVDHLCFKLGQQWLMREQRTPHGHPLAKLIQVFYRRLDRAISDSRNSRCLPCWNGVTLWVVDLAYHFFWIAQNAKLEPAFLQRLRNKNLFWGALHECFVAASFLRAGFTLSFEDESDRQRKHPEFIATSRKTGEAVSVEAKAVFRSQLAELRFSDWNIRKTRIKRLLNDAITKAGPLPHIVVIELSLPPVVSDADKIAHDNRLWRFVTEFHRGHSTTNPDRWNAVYFINRPILFTDGTDVPAVVSTMSAWTAFPFHPHPSLLVSASINEAFNSVHHILDEIKQITNILHSHPPNSASGRAVIGAVEKQEILD
jgi:hypothetical protein